MKLAAFAILPMLLVAGAARADTLVCKQGRIVALDMTLDEVLQKCGPPTSQEKKTEEARAVNPAGYSFKTGEVTVETWRYDRGTQKPAAILVFKEGKLVSITFEQ